jgi:hypothetical protein
MSNKREEELAEQLKQVLEQNATLTRGIEYYSLYHHLFTVSGGFNLYCWYRRIL